MDYDSQLRMQDLARMVFPFLALILTFVLFIVLERRAEASRGKIIAVLAGIVAALAPVLWWMFSEPGWYGRPYFLTEMGASTFWALALVPLDLFLFERARKLPDAYRTWVFTAIAVVTLSPFMFEGLPANFGAVFLVCFPKGYVGDIPYWFMRSWFIDGPSFLLTGALSYFIGRKYLSR